MLTMNIMAWDVIFMYGMKLLQKGQKKSHPLQDSLILFYLGGERWDLNPRPSEPQSDALTN